MNYTELKTNIQDICEQTFTNDQLAMFTQQAEQLIFATVDLPAMRKNQTGSMSLNNKYLTMPSNWRKLILLLNALFLPTAMLNVPMLEI